MNRFIIIFAFLSLKVISGPWIDISDTKFRDHFNELNFLCNKIDPIHLNTNDIPIALLINLLDTAVTDKDHSQECKSSISRFKNHLKKSLYKEKRKLGIQSGISDIYLQDREERLYQNSNIYLSQEGMHTNFSYKLSFFYDSDNNIFFDNSYIEYLNKNIVLSFGKKALWWSPSKDASLILSNSARPQLGLHIKNYLPISFNHNVSKYLGAFNYELFIKKLERNREIPNALLFGNRFSIKPHEKLQIGFSRIAQFGGKNRPVNSSTLRQMILGKDTQNSNLDADDESGNQIAAIDMSLYFLEKNNLNLYFQYAGEDGLDPIIDDRWIGAIFPSKRFDLTGIRYISTRRHFPLEINIEHLDTDSGHKNVVYNHHIYKTGFRYKNLPIGANIDADSHKSFISFSQDINNFTYKIKLQKSLINQNNGIYNSWSKESFELNEAIFYFSKKINNYIFDIKFIIRDSDNELIYKKENMIIKIEKYF